MKKFRNRAFSLLLALVLCLSFFGGIRFTAEAQTVDYVYADGIIKNWGVRGTTATFLSQNAEAFYEDNNTSYEDLAKLPGATATSDVPNSALFAQLHTLMFNNIDLWTSYSKEYDETRYQYQYTDVQNSGKTSTKISSFYSGVEVGPSWDSGSTWNREHTWPNSKGTGASSTSALREADIMMLRPVPSKENSSRSNTAYGESSGYFYPNTGSYDVRGDVARILLYVYTCWGGHSDVTYHNGALNYMWGADGVIESKEVLLSWLEADPVDTWELGRNDSVESITGTRNVFVDFPELGFLLFNEEIPAGYATPSGNAGNGTSYTITAVSGNTAYGTVSLSGKIITATPKTGYEVAGYTVTSGNAEVVRDGNLFAVTAYSDVTVRIDFKVRSQSTLKLAEYGTVANSFTVYTGDEVTLPTVTNTPQTGHTFVGWVAAPTGDVETLPTVYGVGSQYAVSQNTVLYALYSRLDSGGTGNSDLFEPYTGTLTEGDYIFVDKKSDPAAMEATVTSKTRLQYQNVTFTGDNILSPNANIIWHVEENGGYWTIYNAAAKSYAGGTGTKNQAKLLSSVTTYAQWTVQYVNTNTRYEFINRGNDAKGVNPMLRKNGEVGWACYAKNTTAGDSLYLYKRVEGTLVYFTQIGDATCLHPDAHNVSGVSPECDSVGYTAGVYCPDCDEYISGHEEIPTTNHAQAYKEPGKAPTCTESGWEDILYCPDCDEYLEAQVTIPATGHSYTAVVTPPQVGAQGYTTYTCSNCGDSYVADYTAALPEVTLTITAQPQSVVVEPNAKVEFVVEAEGEDLKYTWYYSNDNGESWKKSSLSTTNVFTIESCGTGYHNRQYRVVIADANGNTVTSDAATVQVKYLVKDSATAFGVPVNTDHVFSVEYSVTEGVTYQWQYKGNTSSSDWANTGMTGNKTPNLTVKALSTRNGYQYRCVINDNGTEIITKAAILYVAAEAPTVVTNPVDATAVCGDYATFTIEASGEGALYHWQWYHEGTDTWVSTYIAGYHTPELKVKTNNYNGGRLYRCRIRTVNGSGWNEVYTEPATLTVLPAAEVSQQPQNVTVKAGENAQFNIVATGEGLTYQWQWAKFVGTWRNTTAEGANTEGLVITNVSPEMNGRYYRVIITNTYGGTYTTEYAQLFVEE